jgi:excisionase family DNA binding protein
MNRPYPLQSTFKGITLTSSQESDYYTVAQAAKVLDVSPSTIWRWIKADILPAYRVGPRKIRIKKEELLSIITPARTKEVSRENQPPTLQPPTEEELARRKTLVAQILAKSKDRSIAPLTTADLVRQARAKERRSYAS